MTIRGVHHVSFTVADIESSVAFYERFGFEPSKRYAVAGRDVEEGTGTPRADLEIQWLVHPTGGLNLELIRYRNAPVTRAAHNSVVGAAHICFAVENLADLHASLGADGVEFVSKPHFDDESGNSWVYMRDPDGNAVELLQSPC
jgi:catechol 2,3-dioxygenase-like lactoylglutathione lyase family enzyme